MKKIIIIRIVLIILILLWMRLVFGFSNDNAEVSSSISLRIAKFLVHDDEKAELIEEPIRKLAHLSEYAARWNFVLRIILNI